MATNTTASKERFRCRPWMTNRQRLPSSSRAVVASPRISTVVSKSKESVPALRVAYQSGLGVAASSTRKPSGLGTAGSDDRLAAVEGGLGRRRLGGRGEASATALAGGARVGRGRAAQDRVADTGQGARDLEIEGAGERDAAHAQHDGGAAQQLEAGQGLPHRRIPA